MTIALSPEPYLGALARDFTNHDEAFLDRLVPPGHLSAPGFIIPKFPSTRRVCRGAATPATA